MTADDKPGAMTDLFQPAAPTPPERFPSLWWRLRHLAHYADYSRLFPKSFYVDDFATFSVAPGRKGWVFNAPEAVRVILVARSEDYPKSDISRAVAEPSIGDGMVTANGETWRRKRRLAAPSFHRDALPGFIPAMVAEAQALARDWCAAATPIRLDEGLSRATLRILAHSLMGRECAAEAADISQTLSNWLDRIPFAIMLAGSLPSKLAKPALRWLFHSVTADLDRAASAIYAARARRSGPATERVDLLDQWMSAAAAEDQPMTRSEIRDELVTMIFAGHETTAAALGWALYLLSISPRVRANLEAEVDDVLARRPLQRDDLPRLVYTAAVIKETERLYPVVPLLSRTAKVSEEILPGAKPNIGDSVFISPWLLHRHTKYWRDPGLFRPERFLDDEARPRHVFIPFGSGPRVCVGQSFAEIETVVVLATLVQHLRADILAPERVMPYSRVSLRPKDPLIATIEPRKTTNASDSTQVATDAV
jgi:cytochrome P450